MIFKQADVGLVGDVHMLLPLLIEQLEKIDAQIANNAVLPPRRAPMLFASSPLKEQSNSRQKPRSLRKPKLTILKVINKSFISWGIKNKNNIPIYYKWNRKLLN